ncbi:ABC transporter substrate-binding protein [Aerobium aerolatum]|uniref:Branched-chain amino acid transport system substrate-binding protein n=1 Tax=Aquamicrobium aerolatum DSM 21857 TaxID=1121003 RepID=A0A1I3S6E8_9HYPH|nr:ABC transporter substrate-binding protein [Aquamicrobium aerolatum]SFJ53179.1 branched-chain amino acid transport system substrate-binding protein [Aquamicrobium aerolatum DSM 21857]
MSGKLNSSFLTGNALSRRDALKGIGAAAAMTTAPGFVRYAQSQPSTPIRIGFQAHRTGIGAAYGRWYERTTAAAVKLINDGGGINGRPVEIITEDDGTDAARGAEVVEKFANQHHVDIVYGTLFSHVVVGSAPAAGELKIPYYVVSEGYHVASGQMNRWVLQPGITDVRAQCHAVAPWISQNVGKKVTMIYPDYAFGHDHRDFFAPAIEAQGGEVIAKIAIPPTETTFTRYLPQIPPQTDVIYHVMVGPAVLTFVKELGEFYGGGGPKLFGFIDSLEAVDLRSPGLEFLEGSHFWEGMARYRQTDASEHEIAYRDTVGLDDNGASVNDKRDVSTAGHMFGCWETLHVIKQAMEAADYKGPEDRARLVEATEAISELPESLAHPQGDKIFDGKVHQVFGRQNISLVENGTLKVVHRTSIEDGRYESDTDYTTQPL